MSSEREKEGLQSLGKKTEYRQDYAPEVLEAFENKHPDNDYWNSRVCVPLRGNPILPKSVSVIFPTAAWWKARV